MDRFFAPWALLPGGWEREVLIDVEAGFIVDVAADASPPGGATLLGGPTLPGMPNAHSHVFQRALAGRTERAGPAEDSFWSWRTTMYEFLEHVDPDAFEALAVTTFAEMLEAGYTSVAEFHYVHHAPGGAAYRQPTEMAERVIAAARRTGIGLTLLPVFYQYADFGRKPPEGVQRRFVHSLESFVDAWRRLSSLVRDEPLLRLGLAPHSLRAVEVADLPKLLAAIDALVERPPYDAGEEDAPEADTPVHLHVGEQRREVEACLAAHGTTPIALLARTVELGPRWSLVHATHATPQELQTIARATAVVVVCPTTEANLGDGIFAAREFVDQRGRIAIGSDSNVALDVAEELRWLEYGQRLRLQQRRVLGGRRASLGERLYELALSGGLQSLDQPIGVIAPEARADLVVLASVAREETEVPDLDTCLFRSGAWAVRDVLTGGTFRVREGRHVEVVTRRSPTASVPGRSTRQ